MSRKNMKILIFGASGMVGQGVLREAVLDSDVAEVKCVGRTPITNQHKKLKQFATDDLFQLEQNAAELTGYDACFFCLGASSAGATEASYRRINFDLPLTIASLLAKLNPDLALTYVSGTGTDSSEKGSVMWARVKGETENKLMALPIRASYMFRLAGLIPKNGESSRTVWYRLMYSVMKPITPVFEALIPAYVTTTVQMGRAMLNAAKIGQGAKILENRDIAALAAQEDIA